MPARSIAAVVAGTGFEGRAARIRAFCREGATVQLRREPSNPYDGNAIGVWMRCSLFFGFYRPWTQIGYVKAKRAEGLAGKLDSGETVAVKATVRSFYAPIGRDHPRISLEIHVRD